MRIRVRSPAVKGGRFRPLSPLARGLQTRAATVRDTALPRPSLRSRLVLPGEPHSRRTRENSRTWKRSPRSQRPKALLCPRCKVESASHSKLYGLVQSDVTRQRATRELSKTEWLETAAQNSRRVARRPPAIETESKVPP